MNIMHSTPIFLTLLIDRKNIDPMCGEFGNKGNKGLQAVLHKDISVTFKGNNKVTLLPNLVTLLLPYSKKINVIKTKVYKTCYFFVTLQKMPQALATQGINPNPLPLLPSSRPIPT